MKTNIHLLLYLAHFFLEWEISRTKIVEEIKTHILYSITIFSKIMPFVRKMWKNVLEPDRPQMTIWRMCITCWIPKATNTCSEYVILIAFPLPHWLYERVSLLHYTYSVCLISDSIFLYLIPPLRWRKKAETCRRFAIWLYTVLSELLCGCWNKHCRKNFLQ